MRINPPESSKLLEWLIQIAIVLGTAYSSYRLLEYRVNVLEKANEDHKLFVTREDFKDFKRTWGFLTRSERRGNDGR